MTLQKQKDTRFSGKVAVVTGAGQGLGASFAEGLAAGGASVALIGRTESKLQQQAEAIRQTHHTPVLICPGDVSQENEITALFSRITEAFGPVDILINNAAVHIPLPVAETTLAAWQKQLDVNLTGAFLCSRAVLPDMISRKYGKIINISSSAATHVFPGFGAYAASKAGMIGFTKTLSAEVKQYGINVNVLLLGMINTEGTRRRIEANDPAVTVTPKQMLQVAEVRDTVLFFASDASSAIMGAEVEVFGPKA